MDLRAPCFWALFERSESYQGADLFLSRVTYREGQKAEREGRFI